MTAITVATLLDDGIDPGELRGMAVHVEDDPSFAPSDYAATIIAVRDGIVSVAWEIEARGRTIHADGEYPAADCTPVNQRMAASWQRCMREEREITARWHAEGRHESCGAGCSAVGVA